LFCKSSHHSTVQINYYKLLWYVKKKGSSDKGSCAEKLDNDSEVGKLRLYIFAINKIYMDQITKIEIPKY
jgi:hypothetical protein